MVIYLNSHDTQVTWNKKHYLLNLGLDTFKHIRFATTPPKYVLNIQPSDFVFGSEWTGFWHIDVTLDNEFTDQYYKFDKVFLSTVISKNEIKTDNTQLLYQACEPDIHKRTKEPLYDVAFVGTDTIEGILYEKRRKVLQTIEDKFTYKYFGKNQDIRTYVDNMSLGKVMVVQPHTVETKWGNVGAAAQRFFECLAIGPVLCDWSPDYANLQGLKDGTHYLSYKEVEEMEDKLSFLLKNDDFRETMARKGREVAVKYHTYNHRAKEIIKSI